MRRLIPIALALTVAAGPWYAASAQEEPPSQDTTTVEEPGFQPGREPAVVLQPEQPAAETQAWTFRYLVPTLLTLASLVLLAVLLYYGFRVRGRYRVVR
ncbi:MAG TPA: hypothetical protein VLL51_10990 [Gemmatimonadales bacterium]|nr:hypothetical protein [Gemmatimonadales bacterium]